MAGHLNGSGKRHEEDGDKVASLADARKRAAERQRLEKRAERAARVGHMSLRDWITGAVILAMALGMIWYWVAPLVGATGVGR